MIHILYIYVYIYIYICKVNMLPCSGKREKERSKHASSRSFHVIFDVKWIRIFPLHADYSQILDIVYQNLLKISTPTADFGHKGRGSRDREAWAFACILRNL
jgi:hypothetical protein